MGGGWRRREGSAAVQFLGPSPIRSLRFVGHGRSRRRDGLRTLQGQNESHNADDQSLNWIRHKRLGSYLFHATSLGIVQSKRCNYLNGSSFESSIANYAFLSPLVLGQHSFQSPPESIAVPGSQSFRLEAAVFKEVS